MDNRAAEPTAAEPRTIGNYEPPCVEAVLTSDEVEREIHYAGSLTCPTCGPGNFDNEPD